MMKSGIKIAVPAIILITLLYSSFSYSQGFDYSSLDSALKLYVNSEGLVNYKGVKENDALSYYIEQVKTFDPYSLTERNDKLAFWINAYNAFTISLIAKYYPLKSIHDIEKRAGKNPWKINFININGQKYNLDEIEKDIIIPEFSDPRIHYSLVCAAQSCPLLRNEAYIPTMLDVQLNEQAVNFVNDTKKNFLNRKKKRLYLSMIYKWYSGDFKDSDGTVVDHILKYINEDDKNFIIENSVDNLYYLEYSWKLNDSKE